MLRQSKTFARILKNFSNGIRESSRNEAAAEFGDPGIRRGIVDKQ